MIRRTPCTLFYCRVIRGAMTQARQWKNRIVGTGEEDPEQLLANPFNARIHPKSQQDALEGVLDTVGFVDRVMVNQRTGHVVDGHLRVALAISSGQRGIGRWTYPAAPSQFRAVCAIKTARYAPGARRGPGAYRRPLGGAPVQGRARAVQFRRWHKVHCGRFGCSARTKTPTDKNSAPAGRF